MARSIDGSTVTCGAIRSSHRQHILDVSVTPALVRPQIACDAVVIALEISEQLNVVGILCVEFFLTREG